MQEPTAEDFHRALVAVEQVDAALDTGSREESLAALRDFSLDFSTGSLSPGANPGLWRCVKTGEHPATITYVARHLSDSPAPSDADKTRAEQLLAKIELYSGQGPKGLNAILDVRSQTETPVRTTRARLSLVQGL